MSIGTSLNRDTTNMTVAEFHERYKLGKYNFDPPYQRRGDVWSEEKKAFLIDSVLKNFPMPPIFLHQRIDDNTGETRYDVIDGKQRLGAIVSFIEDEIALPRNFDEGIYGNSALNGLRFSELVGPYAEYRKQLWRYTLSVEYVESSEESTVDEIFDRLNRNGEPLEPQELRNARYHDTKFMDAVVEAATAVNWVDLGKVSFTRMQDQEFASELLLYILEGQPVDASRRDFLDEEYAKWVELTEKNEVSLAEAQDLFKKCLKFIEGLELNFDEYKVGGVSHFYALFALAHRCLEDNKTCNEISSSLNHFYEQLRMPESDNEDVRNYRASMSSNTKARHQRRKRIDALCKYCSVG